MSGSRGFAVTISATDQATAKIDAINKRLAAMQAPADRLQKSFGKLAENTGVEQLAHGMRDVARSSLEAFENIGRIVAPLGVITGAASIAGLARLTSEWADMGAKLSFTAQRAGVSAGRLSELQGAARLAGSSAESMSAGLTTLRDNMFDMATGRAAPLTIAAFDKLGISTRGATGGIRSATDVLPELADKIAAIKDPTQQAQLAVLTLGGAGEDLLPVLRMGARGLAEYRQKVIEYGAVSDRGAVAANELRLKQVELTLAVEGLRNSIGERLAPVLGPMLVDLATWIKDNRELLASDVAGWVKDGVPAIREYAAGIKFIVDALHGWKNAGEDLLIWWGASFLGPLSPIIRTVLVVKEIKAALEDLSGGFEKLIFGQERAQATKRLAEIGPYPDKRQLDWAMNGRPGPMPAPIVQGPAQPLPQGWPVLPATPSSPKEQSNSSVHPGLLNPPLSGPGRMPGVTPPPQPEIDRRAPGLMGRLESDLGITHAAAAADVSNAAAESGLRSIPTGLVAPGPRTAFGIWQFTGPRRVARDAYASAHPGLSPEEVDIQFHEQELRTLFPGLLQRMRTPGIGAGTMASDFYRTYESGGDPGLAHLEGGHTANAERYANMPSAPQAQIGNGSGASPAAAPPATVKGSANLNIRFEGTPPPGTRTITTTEGDLFAPPRIENAMSFPR